MTPATTILSGTPSAQPRWRAFRPVLIYLAVALPILGWDIHRRQAARTFVRVEAKLEGGPLEAPLQVEVDGKPASLDAPVPIGNRSIKVWSRDTEAWSINRFVWYGDNPLGTVQLQRSRGDLVVAVKPVPVQVNVTGRLTNATSRAASASFKGLPVGEYQVELLFQHFTEKLRVRVERNGANVLDRAFPVAHLKADSEPAGSSFEVLAASGDRWFFRGETPGVVNDLPPGSYRVAFARGDYRKLETIRLSAGVTNEARSVFDYGKVSVTTAPTNAVVTLDGQPAGNTPTLLTNLIPGRHTVTVTREGFLTGRWDVDVKGDETVALATNLLSGRYVVAMREAKAHLSGLNYPAVLAQLAEALAAKPGDAEAEGLKTDAQFRLHLQEARNARAAGQLTNALKAIAAALALQPGRAEAATLKNAIESDLRDAEQARQMAAQRQAEEEQRRLAREKELAERQMAAAKEAAERKTAMEQTAAKQRREKLVADTFLQAAQKFPRGARPIWKAGAKLDQVLEALARSLPQCAEKWKVINETKGEELVQRTLTGVGILSSNQRALIQCAQMDGYTEVRATTWFDSSKGLLGAVSPEGAGLSPEGNGYVAEALRRILEKELGQPLR